MLESVRMRVLSQGRGPDAGLLGRGAAAKFLGASVVALVLLAPVGSASAATVTYVSVTGNWRDPVDNVPGPQPGDPVIVNGSPTSSIDWGDTTGQQSGYDFTATIPPPFDLPGNIPFFSLGTFTHRNFSVGDPSLTSVQLDVILELEVDGVPTGPLTFTFTFNHEETPNFPPPPATCPYPTPPGEGCTDRVTIVASAQPTTFNIDGVDYTLSMNFLDNGNPVSEFITREGGTVNTSGLIGDFTLPPGLTVAKTGPATMSVAEWATFVLDVQNASPSDAYNVTLIDRLPDEPTGGMCDTTPEILTAQVFAADGVTPVPGKGQLAQGTDYTLTYDGAACELTFNTLSAQSVIAVGERLVITYRTRLDDDSQNGIMLTNLAGATEWLNDFDTNPARIAYARMLTDGTVGVTDHEDAHTVTVTLPFLRFDKTVMNVTTGEDPATGASPGDTLRYSLYIENLSNVAIADFRIIDEPDNLNDPSGFEAGTLNLIAFPVGADTTGTDPSGGADGTGLLDIGGLTLAADGDPDDTVVIEFEIDLDPAVAEGRFIYNQAQLYTGGIVFAVSDDPNINGAADPNIAGDEDPTVVPIGDAQLLMIAKSVAVVGGGAAVAGATLEYTVTVLNPTLVPALYVEITDDLDMPEAGQLIYVDGSATMNGAPDGITFAGSTLTAAYSDVYGNLPPGEQIELIFQAEIYPDLPLGTRVTNIAQVKWDDPPEYAEAEVSIDVGGMAGSGTLSGTVWHDADFDDQPDADERLLEGWVVELYRDDELVLATTTDNDGNYQLAGIEPTYAGEERYVLRFSQPGAGPNTAALGRAFSANFTNGPQTISDIAVESGSNFVDLNLPIDPNGVVYDSVTRAPIPGAALTMVDAGSGSELPAACFDHEAQQGQISLADGWYKFDINFSEPACPEGNAYLIEVTPPAAASSVVTYLGGPSEIIPPESSATTAALSVPACLQGGAADAIPSSTTFCEATASETAPGAGVGAGSPGTVYYLHILLDNSNNPGSRQIFNNHIPLDPDLADSVSITKQSPALNVRRGQLVPYVITVTNEVAFDLTQVSIVDRFPAGFRYVEGSARIDRAEAEPALIGRELIWSGLSLGTAGEHRIELLLAVGAGVNEGEFINRAQVVHTTTGMAMSGEATATVRLQPDPDFDCTDVLGKVYDDANRNGRQDAGEAGIPGVRLVSMTGLAVTTDSYGRYHITCATVPNEARGSNFVMKVDDRTLPSGFRASQKRLQIARATRGKALVMDFGASIHRVVGLEISDPVFVEEGDEIRELWRSRLVLLLDQLAVAPSVLRLSYLADLEEPSLVSDRIRAVVAEIETRWESEGGDYALEIEPEIFWRRGGPVRMPTPR